MSMRFRALILGVISLVLVGCSSEYSKSPAVDAEVTRLLSKEAQQSLDQVLLCTIDEQLAITVLLPDGQQYDYKVVNDDLKLKYITSNDTRGYSSVMSSCFDGAFGPISNTKPTDTIRIRFIIVGVSSVVPESLKIKQPFDANQKKRLAFMVPAVTDALSRKRTETQNSLTWETPSTTPTKAPSPQK